MGNTYAGASTSSEVLILSFPLDADYDTCQIPCVCPRKKPVFHPPSCLPTSTTSFLDLTEVHKILADINTILSNTQFSTKLSNPCFLLSLLFSMVFLPIAAWNILDLGAKPDWAKKSLEKLSRSLEMNKLGGMTQEQLEDFEREYREELAEEEDGELSSFALFLGVLLLALSLALPLAVLLAGWGCRMSRRRQLKECVARRSRLGDGISLQFGGGGGGGGGTYANFNMALYDQKGLLVSGFLHVYVDPLERQTWCSQSGIPFVPPVPLGSHPPIGGAQPYQPPAGYSLVPTQPSQPYQPPPGFQLVPISND